jgi:HAD superfamily hydrolase (TIGR01549 family)
MPFNHLWLDFSDTIALINRDELGDIVYSAYATHVGRAVTPELREDYKSLVEKYRSNSAVFTALGFPPGYAADLISKVDPQKLYRLTDSHIPNVIPALTEMLPVSIFSNNRLDTILPALGLELQWFTHILGPDEVQKPKPDLEGFNKMIQLSGCPANEILYVGDDVEKDLVPAKKVGITTGLLWKESNEADYSFKDFQDILNLVHTLQHGV